MVRNSSPQVNFKNIYTFIVFIIIGLIPCFNKSFSKTGDAVKAPDLKGNSTVGIIK